MRKRISRLGWAIAAAAVALVALPACAGTELTAVTHVDTAGKKMPKLGDVQVQLRVDGTRARAEYRQSALGSIPVGSVLVTEDGARTAKLYNIEDKTCAAAPSPLAASSASAAPMQVEDIRIDQTLDQPGGKIAGLKTRHRRFEMSYTTSAAPGAKPVRTHVTLEVWSAASLADPAYALWLAPAQRTGNAELDRRLGEAMAGARGAALKRIQRTSLQSENGPERSATSTLEVTRLVQRKFAATDLDPPFACRIGPSRE